jgi:hypothetical protein
MRAYCLVMLTGKQKTNLAKEPLINVGEAVVARQKWPKKRIAPWMALIRAMQEQLPSLHKVNEHFEAIFNNATATQVNNQRFPKN